MDDWTLFGTSFSARDALIALAAGAVTLVLVRIVRRRGQAPESAPYHRDLKPLIKTVESTMLKAVRERLPTAGLFSTGDVHVAPSKLVLWATTQTDAERDTLAADDALEPLMRETLKRVGYPSGAIARVRLDFQSQETVDRDFGGSWFQAIK